MENRPFLLLANMGNMLWMLRELIATPQHHSVDSIFRQ